MAKASRAKSRSGKQGKAGKAAKAKAPARKVKAPARRAKAAKTPVRKAAARKPAAKKKPAGKPMLKVASGRAGIKKAAPKKAASKKAAPKKAASKKAAAESMRMPPTDPATQAALDEVLGARPELRPGKMFGCPGYFLGAKAVACVYGPEVCLTLPQSEIEALLSRPGFRRFEARGRTMSGWVLVERQQVSTPEAEPLFEQAIEYARSKSGAPSKSAEAADSQAETQAPAHE